MNASTLSWIDVTVWKTLTSTPATRPASSIGRLTMMASLDRLTHDADDEGFRHGGLTTKLRTREPTSRFQPSIITNSSILNGSEIIAGGSCSMPIDSSVVETTRSMSRNGTNRKNPIWKPVFSSEMTKAGTTTRIGSSSGVFGRGCLAELDEQREVGLARLLQHERRAAAARRARAPASP